MWPALGENVIQRYPVLTAKPVLNHVVDYLPVTVISLPDLSSQRRVDPAANDSNDPRLTYKE